MPKQPVTLRLSPETLADVRALAAVRDWTPSHFMARAIERIVEAEKAQQAKLSPARRRNGSRP